MSDDRCRKGKPDNPWGRPHFLSWRNRAEARKQGRPGPYACRMATDEDVAKAKKRVKSWEGERAWRAATEASARKHKMSFDDFVKVLQGDEPRGKP